jgi:hypothetical protein
LSIWKACRQQTSHRNWVKSQEKVDLHLFLG